MKGFNPLEKLRLRHLLFVTLTLVSVIPVLLLEVWVERTAEQNEFDAIADKHVLLAHNLTESLSRYVTDVSGVFSFAANSLANGSNDAALLELLERLYFRHLSIVDNVGQVQDKIRLEDGLDLDPEQLRAEIERMQSTDSLPGSVSFSAVSAGSGGRPAIFIGLRLSSERLAIAELSTEYMLQLQRDISFGEMGHAAIVDASGQLLAHPRSDWTEQMKDLSEVAPVARMMAGETGVSFFYSPATRLDMVAGYSTVPGVGWGVMIPQPVYELQQRAREFTQMSTQIVAAGIIIAALLSWWVAGFLSGPITALTQSARSFRPGEDNSPIRLDGLVPIELRALTESFNSMVADVSTTSRALAQKSEVLQITLDNMVEGITLVDHKQRLLVANRQFQKLFDFDARRLAEAPTLAELELEKYAASPEIDLYADYRGNTPELVHCNGKVIELRNNRLADGQLITSYTDVTDRNQADADVRFLASHDALTGLPNRFEFCNRLEQMVDAANASGKPAAMHYIDLDQFKDINDTKGHNVGDLLLLEVGKRLQSCLGKEDSVGRLGGDEFGIIQSNLRSRSDASALAQRVIDVVSEPYHIDESELFIGATVGIILIPEDSSDPQQLYLKADLAMYAAKAENRNTYRFYDPEMEAIACARKFMEDDLRKAIYGKTDRVELTVVYQPILDLHSHRVKGFEALTRWHHPERGFVSPAEFIPLAERSGLIEPLGEWVLEQACMALKKLHRAGFNDLQMSVNLSAVQLRKNSVVERVGRVLRDTGLQPRHLDLEITETNAMHNLEQVLDILDRLHALGVSISIDDFGTGYSSLSQLKSLPVDRIKMDASFIRVLNDDPTQAPIVDAILGLARSMNLPVVAEGVETQEQFRFVSAHGCSEMQGYYLSKPIPEGEVAQWLTDYLERPEQAPRRSAEITYLSPGGRVVRG